MKKSQFPALAILVSVLLLTHSAFSLDSGIRRTWGRGTLQNVHDVVAEPGGPLILRGAAPRTQSDYRELERNKIGEVLIFKVDTRGEVEEEKQELESRGISFVHYSMPWKLDSVNSRSLKPLCVLTVKALLRLKKNEREGVSTYFHCTVGEDRTGMLAALYRLSSARASDSLEEFQEQMCQFGYEAGNPKKIASVVMPIRRTLTPMYRILSEKLKTERLSLRLCDGPEWEELPEADEYQCQTSRFANAN